MDDNLKNKDEKTLAYCTSLDIYIKAIELAKLKGKKPGDYFEEELREVMRANPGKVEKINKSKDLKDKLYNKNVLDLRDKKDDTKNN